MQKKYKLFVTCDMSQPCNMSHFEKIENSDMTCSVKNSNFNLIFELRTKSLHDVQNIYFSRMSCEDFVLASKKKSKFEFFDTALFL